MKINVQTKHEKIITQSKSMTAALNWWIERKDFFVMALEHRDLNDHHVTSVYGIRDLSEKIS